MRHLFGNGFLIGVIEQRGTLKLTWKDDSPIWADRWPLNEEKLATLQSLVPEQLQKGHITFTISPGHPKFCHPKTTQRQMPPVGIGTFP